MGASSWECVVPYQANLGAALAALRHQVFEQGGFLKPSFYGPNGGPGEFGTIRPLSEGEYVELFGVAQPGRRDPRA